MSGSEDARWLRADRRTDRPEVDPLRAEFTRDDPGHPLGGSGMPTGHTLREDGDTHREAWMRVIRRDPCGYCGREGGTVDHIEPRSLPARGLGGAHTVANYAGSCDRCNSKKSDLPLLFFLWKRKVSEPRVLKRYTEPVPELEEVA